jgi:hypothetical protein
MVAVRVLVVALLLAGCDRVFLLADLPPPTDAPFDGITNAGTMLVFDGVDDVVPVLRMIETDFTIEVWVKTTQTTSNTLWHNGIGLICADASSVANDFGLSIATTRAAFGVGMPDATILSTTPITLGTWTHVAASRERLTGLIRLYINGRREAEMIHANRSALDASSTISLGQTTSITATQRFFLGALDEVRLWNVVRGEADISQGRSARLTGSEPGLAGYYRFDEADGMMANDSTSNGFHAVLGGGIAAAAPAWAASDAPIY